MIAFYLQKRQYSRVAGNQGSPKERAIPFRMPAGLYRDETKTNIGNVHAGRDQQGSLLPTL
jgi:hypothetical protein